MTFGRSGAPERPNVKIRNVALDQYGARTCEQQQFGTAGVEGVNKLSRESSLCLLVVVWHLMVLCFVCFFSFSFIFTARLSYVSAV